MAMSKRRRNTILGLGAAVVGGAALFRYVMKKRPNLGPVMPPPPVRPGETIPDIAYEAGGETHLSLHRGAEFRVVWDPLSNAHFSAQESHNVEAVSVGDGVVRFRLTNDLPRGGVDQVFVIATDDNDNVLGEHKVTVHAP